MKKTVILLIALVALLSSCNDYETYGDKKEKERNAISKFIAERDIVVISEDQFNQNGQVTDTTRHEYVKLDKSGVYMQIVRKGCGEKLKDGETVNIVCRFREYNILEDTYTALNNLSFYSAIPDIMRVTKSSASISALFTKSLSIPVSGSNYAGNMYYTYGSASVPAGWLVPLNYVRIGIPQAVEEEIAKVRLIVPHTQGHTTASGNVTPYYYEITFQREA